MYEHPPSQLEQLLEQLPDTICCHRGRHSVLLFRLSRKYKKPSQMAEL
ncbi:hypothetical protein M3204_10085 [Mesobacillus subterraneus]|nr:hypothetical protein [Mesobacillus subterraneus]MCM3664754.1 hypothetical protein [Mesobacillus subterraneus]MCM3681843.1 hypothetical protein [Mesobacillus subterraneus]